MAATKTGKGRSPKYDWGRIKQDYIRGLPGEGSQGVIKWPTLNEVAGIWGIDPSQLRTTAAKQGWTKDREVFRAELDSRRKEEQLAKMAKEGINFDFKALQVAKQGINQIAIRMNNALERYQAEGQPMAITELEKLATALHRYQKTGKLALGFPTDITHETHYEGGEAEDNGDLSYEKRAAALALLAGDNAGAQKFIEGIEGGGNNGKTAG